MSPPTFHPQVGGLGVLPDRPCTIRTTVPKTQWFCLTCHPRPHQTGPITPIYIPAALLVGPPAPGCSSGPAALVKLQSPGQTTIQFSDREGNGENWRAERCLSLRGGTREGGVRHRGCSSTPVRPCDRPSFSARAADPYFSMFRSMKTY